MITHKHTDKFLDRFKAWIGINLHIQSLPICQRWHHYIHPDIKQNRSITVREAARLQGFPDDFYSKFKNKCLHSNWKCGSPYFERKIAQAIKIAINN
ncbi:DNA cytosine methyltransferase [Streptococcus agalactiae]|uniref:DNA cytosine methyltransferase n=1 Tax=Streptococcus agalactiae TaxID=1311 RepID=UPI002869499C|nr:DNA cytosine methyltransferase [Streptococcus agalactiae]